MSLAFLIKGVVGLLVYYALILTSHYVLQAWPAVSVLY